MVWVPDWVHCSALWLVMAFHLLFNHNHRTWLVFPLYLGVGSNVTSSEKPSMTAPSVLYDLLFSVQSLYYWHNILDSFICFLHHWLTIRRKSNERTVFVSFDHAVSLGCSTMLVQTKSSVNAAD